MEHFAAIDFAKIGKIVDFDAKSDRLLPMDFTVANTELTPEILANTALFSDWIVDLLYKNNARYGIGGYNEHRTIYGRSKHFDELDEPRRLHLGVDIWGPAGTPIYNCYEATVHSFCFNDNFGDYGATIVLRYEIDGVVFFALYGHLNLASLEGLYEGKPIPKGEMFAKFGIPTENGFWPPHLHFQLILDMEGKKGDYPGVCQFSKRAAYLQNCPDPNPILIASGLELP